MEKTIEPINRVAFNLGPIDIYWYSVIIISGALLGLWLAIRESERRNLPKDTLIDLVLFAFPISIIVARVYYVIFKWDYYIAHPNKIIAIREGGLAMHGVLIGAVLTIMVFAKVRKISFWKLCDILAPSIILGQVIGRWETLLIRKHTEALYLGSFLNLCICPILS